MCQKLYIIKLINYLHFLMKSFKKAGKCSSLQYRYLYSIHSQFF